MKAIHGGVNAVVRTLFVILATGAQMGTLCLCGSVAAVVYFWSDRLADPYTSISIVGGMCRKVYKRQRIPPVVLSTSMADSGAIMRHIIPWNNQVALFAGTLDIATINGHRPPSSPT